MTSEYTLNQEEILALEEERVFLGPLSNGKRKVSAALLSLLSSQGSVSSMSSGSSASVRIQPFDSSTEAPFDLPEHPESVAALEFIGFTRETAQKVFERYINRPDPIYNIYGLREHAISQARLLQHDSMKDVPAVQAMTYAGISDELQTSLLDPQFTQVFQTETLCYWVEDTINLRYSTLKQLLERLKACAGHTVAKRNRKKRAKIQGVFEQGGSSSTPEQANPTTHSLSAYATLSSNTLPSTYVSVETRPQLLPNHVILYKGKGVGEMSEGFILEDGSVNMNSIWSIPRGDFNQQKIAWYWTKQKQLAEAYRAWAERRSPRSETWVIQIQVPEEFLNGLRMESIWYSQDWKEYLWYCRKGVGSLPAKYDRLHKFAELIEGHCCGRVTDITSGIEKEDIQTGITQDFVMDLGPCVGKAEQVVFMDPEVVNRLAEVVRGKIYIEIHLPTGSVAPVEGK